MAVPEDASAPGGAIAHGRGHHGRPPQQGFGRGEGLVFYFFAAFYDSFELSSLVNAVYYNVSVYF